MVELAKVKSLHDVQAQLKKSLEEAEQKRAETEARFELGTASEDEFRTSKEAVLGAFRAYKEAHLDWLRCYEEWSK